MLQQFVPRVSVEAKLPLLLRGTVPFLGALPRRPAFFSTTARRYNPDIPPAERSGTAATAAAATTIAKSTAAASEAAGAESKPIPTNLDNPPEAVACTVSPPTTYAFLKPTPVVLLTGPFGGNWCFRDTWQTSLADQGYQSTSIELAMPPQKLDSGDAYIRHFVKVLKTSIETDHSFYPPILIAHGLHALVAQKYVESNPVSALVLVSPFIPEIIKGRFQELSHKLQIKQIDPSPSSTAATVPAEDISVADPKADGEQSTSATAQATPSENQPEYKFETHADVLAQEGFRETYVLPKKAVYKIDLVAKEIQEKEKAKEKEQKEKKEEREQKDEKEQKEQKEQEDPRTLHTSERQEQHHMSASGSPGDATEVSTATATSTISTPETLGKDSVPIGESAADAQVTPGAAVDQETSAKQTMDLKEQDDAFYPEQTVESEASIQSPLEQLPLAIYDSIPKSEFEPTFPILLVTSNADEIVSTVDVKEHHFLAQEVDHIELEDRDDGGHLIMVSDNTEWEQGIQGITAWLDSNGM